MMNLCNFNKTLPFLLLFVLLSACAPVTTAPTATLQPTASPAPTQPPCSTVASEPTPIPGADSLFPAVRAGELLAAGKIDEAEAYMEARRQFFWDNGYAIRKLNQAYFAFFGAYADVPGGAAGEDPVGPAVRALRAQSASLADFLNTISWMNSFEDLLEAIGQ